MTDTRESGEEAGEEERDQQADDSAEAAHISWSRRSADVLLWTEPEDIQPLSAIKRHVDYMCDSAQKQTTVSDFFDVVLFIDLLCRMDYHE